MSKVLVVEDDITLAEGIRYTLEREGFCVNIASNLAQARKEFAEGVYKLILLDVMLPDGSGYDLCKEIRQESSIPIIFLTACDEEVNVVLGLDMGGDDYIAKPFRVRELISRIKAVLRRRSEDKPTSYLKFNDIEVDLLKAQLLKDGQKVDLTPIEWKLITVFINNPNQVLTRSVILDKLWDQSGDFVDDNTLSVYIRRIRGKIEKDPSNPKLIQTIRGMGYKWNK
ncbi:response regulator transcription factor [Proteinivorax hydrogeniformans]|uniref:Stage 0 sporulation protein A homolog n=1 Tax=Proteinivorax hydrogeniformans TaxID=1826727 RepID=A0AAU8HSB0_9FIRM